MMRMNHVTTPIRVDRRKLVEAVRAAMAEHQAALAEARAGFQAAYAAELEAALAAVRAGRLRNPAFTSRLPVDHTSVYRSALALYEAGVEDTVLVTPDEFRQLVQNEWPWSREFWAANARYSVIALSKHRELGGAADDDAAFDLPVGGAPQ